MSAISAVAFAPFSYLPTLIIGRKQKISQQWKDKKINICQLTRVLYLNWLQHVCSARYLILSTPLCYFNSTYVCTYKDFELVSYQLLL